MTVVRERVRNYTTPETTYDTGVITAGADAIDMAVTITPVKEFSEVQAHQATPSKIGDVEGMERVSATIEGDLKHTHNGTPELDTILQSAWGPATGTATRNYALSSALPSSHQLVQTDSSELLSQANGLILTEWRIGAEKGSPVSFSGTLEGATFTGMRGNPTVASGSGTGVVITSGVHRNKIRFGRSFLAQFASDTNSGAGHNVSAYVTSSGAATLTTTLAAPLSSGDIARPFGPAPTYTGSRVNCIANACTLNGVAVSMISCTITGQTGYQLTDRESTIDRPNGLDIGTRDISGTLAFYARDENAELVSQQYLSGVTRIPLVLRLGPSTGPSFTFTFPSVKINTHEVAGNSEGIVSYEITFNARRNSSDNDEMTVVAS